MVMGVALTGCQRLTPPPAPENATAVEVGEDELTGLWDAALAVLRKFDFRPDRQDRAAGIITTHPTTSKQWWEPWRQDVADRYGMAEASVHTVRRLATIRFVNEPGGWTMDVQVDVYRLSAPDRQVTTASSAIRSFSDDLPTVTGEVLAASRSSERWVLLRRDPALEERLLNRILAY
jgi:hypothetical protein